MSKKTTTKSKSKKPAKASDPDIVPLKVAMAKPAKGKGKAPASAKTAKKLSCLDAAAQVLKTRGEAMNCKGMIDAMLAGKLWHSDAPTPAATLYSAILRELQTKKDAARFKKTDRGLFAFNAYPNRRQRQKRSNTMQIRFVYDKADHPLDTEQTPEHNLDDLLDTFTQPQVRVIINQTLETFRAICDLWNQRELAERRALAEQPAQEE